MKIRIRKTVTLFLIVMLAFSLFSFVSCNGKGGSSDDGKNSEQTSDESGSQSDSDSDLELPEIPL